MAKRPIYRSRYKAPKEYSPDTMERTIRGVYDDINRLSGDIGTASDDLGRATLQITEGPDVPIGEVLVQGYVEWFQYFDTSTSTEMAEGRLVVTSRSYDPAAELVRYVVEVEGNVKDTSTWLPVSGIVVDPTYPLGGYYRVSAQIPLNTDEHGLLTMGIQLRVDGATWIEDYMRFDIDLEPKVRTMSLAIGIFEPGGKTWPVYASITCDEDTASFAFAASYTPFPADPDTISDSLFNLGITDGRQGSNILLANLTPSPINTPTTVYVVARAYFSPGKVAPYGRIIGRAAIQIPYDLTDPSLIEDGKILAGQIEAISQSYWIDIQAAHSATPATIININSARITWSDGFTVNLPFHTIDVSAGPGLFYVYYHYSTNPTQLQVTQNKATATSAGSRKVFIGIAQGGNSFDFEAAWWVFASDTPVISAAWIYAASLRALSIKTSDLDVTGVLSTAGDHIRMGYGAIGTDLHGILVTDEQAVPVRRIEIGELGLGADEYGVRVRNAAGIVTFDSSGPETYIGNLFLGASLTVQTPGVIKDTGNNFVLDEFGVAVGSLGRVTNALYNARLDANGFSMDVSPGPVDRPSTIEWINTGSGQTVAAVRAMTVGGGTEFRIELGVSQADRIELFAGGSEIQMGFAGVDIEAENNLNLLAGSDIVLSSPVGDFDINVGGRYQTNVSGTLPVIDIQTNGVNQSRFIMADSGISLNSPGDISLGLSNDGPVWIASAAGLLSFYQATPIAKQTGVGVDAASIHAALTALGLIQA